MYMFAVLAVGICVIALALANLPFKSIDLGYLLLFCVTIGFGSRVTVQIPQLKSHIAVSDIFIFLALILYGGSLAIALAAVEAFFSSWRFCNKKLTVFFNSAAAAISTAAVVGALEILGLFNEEALHGKNGKLSDFLIALSAMAVTYFVVNTVLAAIYDSITERINIWDVWKKNYLWAFVTFFIGAAGAGALVQLSDELGFSVIVAAVPIILLVYAAYRMYLTTVRLSIDQAEQAEKYARQLEDQAVALKDSEERFRTAFTHAPIGIALVSRDGQWTKVNRALCDTLGYSENELLNRSFASVIHPDDLRHAVQQVGEVLSGRSPDCQIEPRYVHSSGSTVWTSVNISSIDEGLSSGSEFVFQVLDITEKKLAEEKLQHEASHDSLTGLPNRSHFMKRLDAALRKVNEDPKYRVGVLFIDLDRFKFVNDSLGHFIGDELLVATANRLNASIRPPDMVARLGGDEFVVLVEGRHSPEKVTRIAERIQKKIGTPFKLQGHEVFTTASIGVLKVNGHHQSSGDVIRDADTAMYHAKRSGKARYQTFDDEMRESVRETLQLETDLRRAIQNDELKVNYQPIFSLEDERLHSLEALARWEHPKLGIVSPERFVPLAEEMGLMDELGDHVMRTACRRMSELRRMYPAIADAKLSVNLSSKQFGNESILGRVEQILAETGFPADMLKLEITETVFFEDHEQALEVLHKLRKMGIETDIDDFGTGYSNLGYLVTLPISTLKIDRSFVMLMGENPANREVIRTIISLAANLGFKVIAEGVESEHQRDMLKTLGCDYGQGYYYSRPLSSEAISDFIFGLERPRYFDATQLNFPEVPMIQ